VVRSGIYTVEASYSGLEAIQTITIEANQKIHALLQLSLRELSGLVRQNSSHERLILSILVYVTTAGLLETSSAAFTRCAP
jgi:hypothetical protein